MRITAVLFLFLCLIFAAVVGCSSGEPPGVEPTQEGSQDILETFKAWFGENHSSEEWYGQIDSIALVSRLRIPTILVFVNLDSGAFVNEANQAVNLWANSDHGQELALRIISSDGFVFTIPQSIQFAVSVPPAPASAEEFMAWLDSAFGSASGDPVNEEWYGHIKSAGINVERESIEIVTDLNFHAPADRELAEMITQVVILASPAGVSNWIVRFGDGSFESSGSL